ncbi:hypothetical protein PHJA_000412100 [Phtheirospermum japonicum]|uniref:Uncharacterized protein n=1 Tax=Phtheirospermum japonicum TaxID=374723 RepID=A0A830B4Y4_9LAMI|nr:hypothetical protein PHJA_000412100 [Phtheirospermum japonicum]
MLIEAHDCPKQKRPQKKKNSAAPPVGSPTPAVAETPLPVARRCRLAVNASFSYKRSRPLIPLLILASPRPFLFLSPPPPNL